jgi:hypothetical protein
MATRLPIRPMTPEVSSPEEEEETSAGVNKHCTPSRKA